MAYEQAMNDRDLDLDQDLYDDPYEADFGERLGDNDLEDDDTDLAMDEAAIDDSQPASGSNAEPYFGESLDPDSDAPSNDNDAAISKPDGQQRAQEDST